MRWLRWGKGQRHSQKRKKAREWGSICPPVKEISKNYGRIYSPLSLLASLSLSLFFLILVLFTIFPHTTAATCRVRLNEPKILYTPLSWKQNHRPCVRVASHSSNGFEDGKSSHLVPGLINDQPCIASGFPQTFVRPPASLHKKKLLINLYIYKKPYQIRCWILLFTRKN